MDDNTGAQKPAEPPPQPPPHVQEALKAIADGMTTHHDSETVSQWARQTGQVPPPAA